MQHLFVICGEGCITSSTDNYIGQTLTPYRVTCCRKTFRNRRLCCTMIALTLPAILIIATVVQVAGKQIIDSHQQSHGYNKKVVAFILTCYGGLK
jgi:hypothetical protein